MSRRFRRFVLYGYCGAAAAWLGYTAYLGIAYDMMAAIMLGAIKILAAATVIAGLAFAALGWLDRRIGRRRSAFGRWAGSIMRNAPLGR